MRLGNILNKAMSCCTNNAKNIHVHVNRICEQPRSHTFDSAQIMLCQPYKNFGGMPEALTYAIISTWQNHWPRNVCSKRIQKPYRARRDHCHVAKWKEQRTIWKKGAMVPPPKIKKSTFSTSAGKLANSTLTRTNHESPKCRRKASLPQEFWVKMKLCKATHTSDIGKQ